MGPVMKQLIISVSLICFLKDWIISNKTAVLCSML